MGNTLVSVRLPLDLAARLEWVAERLESSPGQIVEVLLGRSEADKDAILRTQVAGPFSEKISFRISPEGMGRLRRITGYREIREGEFGHDIEPSELLRRMIAASFSPAALQAAYPDAPEFLLKDRKRPESGRGPRPRRAARTAVPPKALQKEVVILVLFLLALVVTAVVALIRWAVRRAAEGRRKRANENTGRDHDVSSGGGAVG